MASSIHDPAVRFLANESIMVARAGIARLRDFTTDFTADAAQPGSTMLIQFFDDGEAGVFNRTSNNYGHADANCSFIPVKFSNHAKKTFEFTPEDYLNIGSKRWKDAGAAMGRAVSRACLTTAVKLINATNIPADASVQDKHVDEDGTVTGTLLHFGAFNEVSFGDKFSKDYVAEGMTAACEDADIDPADTVPTPFSFSTARSSASSSPRSTRISTALRRRSRMGASTGCTASAPSSRSIRSPRPPEAASAPRSSP